MGWRLQPRHPLPPENEWTIELELVDHLATIVEKTKPKRIIECGSGLSTLVMAYALEKNGFGSIVSMENNPRFANQTNDWLHRHGLAKWADIRFAPITRVKNPWDQMDYPWYEVPDSVNHQRFDFMFVDGPEGHICHMARWPAIFVLRNQLEFDCTIVCDDTNRKQEEAMVKHWVENVPGLSMEKLGTWRGATVLRRGTHANTEVAGESAALPQQEAAGRQESSGVRGDEQTGAEGRPNRVSQEA